MYQKFKYSVITAAVLLACSTAVYAGQLSDMFSSGTSSELQHDLDIARLNDLKVLGGHIESYYRQTGKYPLQGASERPNYVYIATKEQRQYVQGGPPYPHVNTDVAVLIKELERVLGENIEIPFDPQRVPVNKPNFYIYLVTEDSYFLAVHLFEPYPFAKAIAKHYHKLEVTNVELDRPGAWLYSELMANESYISAASTMPNKPGYVEHVRRKLGGKSAF